MEITRKPIGKKLRFDVFKRDYFKCQYCGSCPPSVVLEIDHIHPVAKGGTNNINNLVTSCFECNRGKSKNELNQIPSSLAENIERMKEKEAQYKAFRKMTERLNNIITEQVNEIESIYTQYYPNYVFSDLFRKSTVMVMLKKLNVEELKDAMYIAVSKCLDETNVLKYFCGVCYNKIKENQKIIF